MQKVVVEIAEFSRNARRQLVQVGKRRTVLSKKLVEHQLSLPELPEDPEPGVDYRLPQYHDLTVICDYVEGMDIYTAEPAATTRTRKPANAAA